MFLILFSLFTTMHDSSWLHEPLAHTGNQKPLFAAVWPPASQWSSRKPHSIPTHGSKRIWWSHSDQNHRVVLNQASATDRSNVRENWTLTLARIQTQSLWLQRLTQAKKVFPHNQSFCCVSESCNKMQVEVLTCVTFVHIRCDAGCADSAEIIKQASKASTVSKGYWRNGCPS